MPQDRYLDYNRENVESEIVTITKEMMKNYEIKVKKGS